MALDAELKIDDADGRGAKVDRDLDGVTVLYVGGRPGLIN